MRTRATWICTAAVGEVTAWNELVGAGMVQLTPGPPASSYQVVFASRSPVLLIQANIVKSPYSRTAAKSAYPLDGGIVLRVNFVAKYSAGGPCTQGHPRTQRLGSAF